MEPDTLRFGLARRARSWGLWLVAYGGRNMFLMSGLCRAYLALSLASEPEDGSRAMPLARFGAFEVRLIELAGRRMARTQTFGSSCTDTIFSHRSTVAAVGILMRRSPSLSILSPVQRDCMSHGTHVYPEYSTQMIF